MTKTDKEINDNIVSLKKDKTVAEVMFWLNLVLCLFYVVVGVYVKQWSSLVLCLIFFLAAIINNQMLKRTKLAIALLTEVQNERDLHYVQQDLFQSINKIAAKRSSEKDKDVSE